MIQQSSPSSYPPSPAIEAKEIPNTWQAALQQLITDPQVLLAVVGLDQRELPAQLAARIEACQQFPLRVTRHFVDLMEKGNPEDPLLLQALPSPKELDFTPGYSSDPLEENSHNPAPGLIHKYHGRVLLTTSGQCAINCRYCFRRHFPYGDNRLSKENWENILEYISQNNSIKEVIFSGGDPLSVANKQLARQFQDLEQIPHVKRLRIHSRLPVVLPQRLDDDLIQALKESPLQKVLVIHANHPNEIHPLLGERLTLLKQAGIELLNQSVLLKGVNDNVETLALLSEKLFAAGVLPYYLHLLDPVTGAAHFDIPESKGKALAGELAAVLPGYLVPRLTREQAGASAKVSLAPTLT
ncbi:MAG: EF-P beta-lysylation protein EpmB [Cellvibrionaceae bacterium]